MCCFDIFYDLKVILFDKPSETLANSAAKRIFSISFAVFKICFKTATTQSIFNILNIALS